MLTLPRHTLATPRCPPCARPLCGFLSAKGHSPCLYAALACGGLHNACASRAKCQHSCQHSHCVLRRAQGRERSERHLPPFLAVRFLFHPLPAYGQRLVAPSAHLIPLEKCSAGMFIPLEKCSEWMIIPLEKCIFVPEIPENVMLKRKIEQAPHSRFLLAQREPPITKQGTYP